MAGACEIRSKDTGMMRIDPQGLDNMTKFFANMPGVYEKARNSALGSIGYALKDKAKAAVGANTFGWPDVSLLATATKKFPANRNPAGRTNTRDIIQTILLSRGTRKAWGSLANLLVYSVEKDQGILLFGFQSGTFGKKTVKTSTGSVKRDNYIGQSVVLLAQKLTDGFSYTITSKAQQRYFAALGFPFSLGRTLNIPERPLVGRTFQLMQPEIPSIFREKFWASVRRNTFPEVDKFVNMVF